MARRISKPRKKGRPGHGAHRGERAHDPLPEVVLPRAEGTEQGRQRPIALPYHEIDHDRAVPVLVAEGPNQSGRVEPGDAREHLGRTTLEFGGSRPYEGEEGVGVGRCEPLEGCRGLVARTGVAVTEQGQKRREVTFGRELRDVRPEAVKEADDGTTLNGYGYRREAVLSVLAGRSRSLGLPARPLGALVPQNRGPGVREREKNPGILYESIMFLRRVIETTFQIALSEELARRDMTIRELSDLTRIPLPTLYKCSSGERDPRLSTVRRIAEAFEPRQGRSVAVIAARFLLDEVAGRTIEIRGRPYPVRGYAANSLEECIVAAVRAEKEGAAAIICAPVLASIVERIVDVPVVILKPKAETVTEALEAARRRL